MSTDMYTLNSRLEVYEALRQHVIKSASTPIPPFLCFELSRLSSSIRPEILSQVWESIQKAVDASDSAVYIALPDELVEWWRRSSHQRTSSQDQDLASAMHSAVRLGVIDQLINNEKGKEGTPCPT
jgi:hypothetical protein